MGRPTLGETQAWSVKNCLGRRTAERLKSWPPVADIEFRPAGTPAVAAYPPGKPRFTIEEHGNGPDVQDRCNFDHSGGVCGRRRRRHQVGLTEDSRVGNPLAGPPRIR